MIRPLFLMLLSLSVVGIVTLPAIAANTVRKLYRRESIREYFHTIAIGFDQAGGSILYAKEDWTVSSWTYVLHTTGNRHATVFMRFIDLLFGKNHCKQSWEWESQKHRSEACEEKNYQIKGGNKQ
ncbi:MAG: hypothetical protein AB1763_09485 [Campylobacterota bacterium]